MSYSSRKGFIKDCWLPPHARDFLFKELELNRFCTESLQVFGHLLENILEQYYSSFPDGHKGYVIPVDMTTRDKKFGCKCAHKKYFKPLANQGLIRIHPFDKDKKRCYQYEIPEAIAELYKQVLIDDTVSYINDEIPLVRLHDGKEKKTKFTKSKLYDQNRNPLPKIQTEAINNCKSFQNLNVELFYEVKLKERAELQERINQGEKDLDRLLRRVEGDLVQVNRLLQRKGSTSYQTLWYGSQLRSFKICQIWFELNADSPFGRIYDHRSLYLNLTGESKALLRFCYDLQGKLQYNYDVVACYLYLVKDLSKRYEVALPILNGDIKSIRKQIAYECGISEKTAKQIWNAVTFKAKLFRPETAKRHAQESEAVIIKLLRDELSDDSSDHLDVERFESAYQGIYNWLHPYSKGLDKIIQAYINDPNNIKRGKGGKYVLNAVGRCYPVPKTLNREMLVQLQTHILQGLEGAFIQGLAGIQQNYDYSVNILEHDGATISGKIPQEAIEEAKQDAGFPSAKLESKDNKLQNEHSVALASRESDIIQDIA